MLLNILLPHYFISRVAFRHHHDFKSEFPKQTRGSPTPWASQVRERPSPPGVCVRWREVVRPPAELLTCVPAHLRVFSG